MAYIDAHELWIFACSLYREIQKKHPNTKIVISQKRVNIFAPNFCFFLFRRKFVISLHSLLHLHITWWNPATSKSKFVSVFTNQQLNIFLQRWETKLHNEFNWLKIGPNDRVSAYLQNAFAKQNFQPFPGNLQQIMIWCPKPISAVSGYASSAVFSHNKIYRRAEIWK